MYIIGRLHLLEPCIGKNRIFIDFEITFSLKPNNGIYSSTNTSYIDADQESTVWRKICVEWGDFTSWKKIESSNEREENWEGHQELERDVAPQEKEEANRK